MHEEHLHDPRECQGGSVHVQCVMCRSACDYVCVTMSVTRMYTHYYK